MVRRFYRSRNEKMIAGVAGGIAQYLEVDPVIVRVAFAIAFFASGFGLLAYILLWILVPPQPWHMAYPAPDATRADEGAESEPSIPTPSKRISTWTASMVIGVIMVIFGIIALLDNLVPDLDTSIFWPILLIAMGIGLLVRHRKNDGVPVL